VALCNCRTDRNTTHRRNTSLFATKDVWVSINDWVTSHPVAIIGKSIVDKVAASVRVTLMPKVVTIVIESIIAEDAVSIIVIVAIKIAIYYWDVPSSNIVSIVDIATMDNMATGISISIEPYAAAVVVEGIVDRIIVEPIRLPEDMTLGSMTLRVAINNRKLVNNKRVILEPSYDSVTASIRMTTDDNVGTIKNNCLAENAKAVVEPMAYRVAVHNGTTIDEPTIVDIALVHAVVAVVHSTVNNNAAPIEDNGVANKLHTTINDSTSSYEPDLNMTLSASANIVAGPQTVAGPTSSRCRTVA
jgi:hypothetical protein